MHEEYSAVFPCGRPGKPERGQEEGGQDQGTPIARKAQGGRMKNKMDTKAPRCYGGALFYKGKIGVILFVNQILHVLRLFFLSSIRVVT